MPLLPELTLIVAATNKMGIGMAGELPWTGLKKEMSFFSRVTRAAGPGACGLPLPTINAVIMGRTTWESIPSRFRPLKERRNIILSRHPDALSGTTSSALVVKSLQEALVAADGCARIFVIGGAQTYAAALALSSTTRILFTRILAPFDCDTHFPLDLGEEGSSAEGWSRTPQVDWQRWTGEADAATLQSENGTPYVFEMWEKRIQSV
ncbi:unnamed protein product [Blumeria hordei]|uniref:Dihydrofolate reductase n=2 Tax=Blumeria hordei TaxID=2867405 RepID=A0A383UKU2_BLUHO|nr:Dihydrofolate reductase/DFR1 [Blumeria hordei DH14]SZF00934.1 unnamed protein product [Blumeria hordei]